jgi:hypothetical protein
MTRAAHGPPTSRGQTAPAAAPGSPPERSRGRSIRRPADGMVLVGIADASQRGVLAVPIEGADQLAAVPMPEKSEAEAPRPAPIAIPCWKSDAPQAPPRLRSPPAHRRPLRPRLSRQFTHARSPQHRPPWHKPSCWTAGTGHRQPACGHRSWRGTAGAFRSVRRNATSAAPTRSPQQKRIPFMCLRTSTKRALTPEIGSVAPVPASS